MDSSEYWSKREKAWQLKQIADDRKRMKAIMNKLFEAQEAIQKEINANWAAFAGSEGISVDEAMKRADKMDVKAFAKKAKKLVKDKDFSHAANHALKLYNVTMRTSRLELLKANIGLELIKVFDELEKYMGIQLSEVALAEFERQAGILGLSIPKDSYSSLIQAVIASGFKETVASFSNSLWQYQYELKADLEKLLIRGVTQGKNPKALASELRKYMTEKGRANATYNAQRLMITETTRVQTAIQKQSYDEAEIEEYKFIAEPNACQICLPLHDKIFKVKEMAPGENAPNMHPNCKCSTAPYVDDIDFWSDLRKRGVISQREYEEAFEDKAELDRAIEELRQKRKGNKK